FLLFLCLGDHLHLHSFPTRRSSDLIRAAHGDIIVRLDAHTVPPVDFISRCVKALEESGWNAIVGGRCRILPSTDSAVARAIAWAVTHPLGSGRALYRSYVPGSSVRYDGVNSRIRMA